MILAIAFLLATQLTGGEFAYTVQKSDTLLDIGSRFGVDVRVIAEANGLESKTKVKPGQVLQIDNRHIALDADGSDILVNVPQRMLVNFKDGKIEQASPIAAGKPTWRTPLGEFEILSIEKDPTWDVPVSIQAEMARAGKPVLTHVPPSPQNPLGKFWLGLSIPGLGLHGTNAPSSIYSLQTHGCIRLRPDDIAKLSLSVAEGARGKIVYEPVLMTTTEGKVFLEVHPDKYKRAPDPFAKVLELTQAGGLHDVVDWALIKEAIRKRDGIARDVTLRVPTFVP